MALYRDDTTGRIGDYPVNIARHPVLGAHLHAYDPETDEYEEDKVIVSGEVKPVKIITPKPPVKPAAPAVGTSASQSKD